MPVVAVSDGMRADILECYPALEQARVHVIRNGIDTSIYHATDDRSVLTAKGVDLHAPIASFVGRITRQKGVGHLIASAHRFDPEIQLVLCAGAPDTPQIAKQTATAIRALQAARPGVFWFDGMLTLDEVKQVLTASTVFCCPSVYEPLGIVNLDAMACGAPVVASDVSGTPRWSTTATPEPWRTTTLREAAGFARAFAAAVNATGRAGTGGGGLVDSSGQIGTIDAPRRISPSVRVSTRNPPRWISVRRIPGPLSRSRCTHGSQSRRPSHSTSPMRNRRPTRPVTF